MLKKTVKVKQALIFALFITILVIPVLLFAVGRIFGIKANNSLRGYTVPVDKVELSAESVLDTSYQTYWELVLPSKFPIYEAAVRTYNTIRYMCFNEGRGIIGKNHNLFEYAYVKAEYGFEEFNYASPQKDAELQETVDHLVSVNRKLRSKGKYLFVYVAPGKCRLYPEDVPEKYTNLIVPEAVNVTNLFREKIAKTEVPYLFCEDYGAGQQYPAFNKTGIHWSRTYEQECSKRIIDCLKEITGNNYRNFEIVGTEESSKPFWRDDDMFLLQNTWLNPGVQYYQYYTVAQNEGEYDRLNILLQGDSFGMGLMKDIFDNIPEDRMIHINRDDSVSYSLTDGFSISDDWNNLDLAVYLDISDIVIVEMTDPEISHYSYGFVQYLDTFLDTYQPGEGAWECFPAEYKPGFEAGDKFFFCNGLYLGSSEYVWAEKECWICINTDEVSENGLFIKLDVPAQVFWSDPEPDTVTVKVNNVEVACEPFLDGGEKTIYIPKEKLPKSKDGTLTVVINASKVFNPKKIGENNDDRDLALRLRYVGGNP